MTDQTDAAGPADHDEHAIARAEGEGLAAAGSVRSSEQVNVGQQSIIEGQLANLTARVTALEERNVAVAKTQAVSPQQPSKGRIVIHRDATGNEYAAMITRVNGGANVSLLVFIDDAAPRAVSSQTQIDPSAEGAVGWFWPPRI